MDSESFGSFAISCRLGVALQAQPFRPKRLSILASFLTKYNNARHHIDVLIEVLFSGPIAVASTTGVSDRHEGWTKEGKWSVDDVAAVLCSACRVRSLSELSYGSSGTLSLEAAQAFLQRLRVELITASDDPSKNSLGRQHLQLRLDPNYIASVAAQCTAKEFELLLCAVVGERSALVGLTAIDEILECISPAAHFSFRENGDLAEALDLACGGGSPRAALERDPTVDSGPPMDDPIYDVEASPDGFLGRQSTFTFRPSGQVGERPSSGPELHVRVSGGEPEAPVARRLESPSLSEDREEGHKVESTRKRPRVDVEVTEVEAKPEDSLRAPSRDKRGDGTRGKKPLKPCRYGDDCRRKNPEHFKEYSHPKDFASPAAALPTESLRKGGGDADGPTPTATKPRVVGGAAPAAPKVLDPADFVVKGIAPLRAMPEYEFVFVDGTSGASHKMKNCGDGVYTCTCPVWRYQSRGTNERTCKHLQQYLGEEFEAARCGLGADSASGDTRASATATRATGGASPLAGKKFAMPGVLLANKADSGKGYDGWWCSEKLDGVRAYWDGHHLLSRNGNAFTPPEWFISGFPKGVTLDGELFGGRKKFQTTVGIVKSSPSHPGWATLTYEIFDIPSSGDKPFERRIEELERIVASSGVKHLHIVTQEKCTGSAYIESRLRAVEELGGEGLMLREPGSRYVHARSNTLLKVKSTEEVDAIIRGYDAGKGKNVGRVGALHCELPNGKQFFVGSGLSDAQRAKPPAIGTVICVRFQELTDGGVPRFPVFAGCRYDVDWPTKL